MSEYKLDRTAFRAHSVKEPEGYAAAYKNLSWKKWLEIAHYLNSVAFNFDPQNPPRMDRSRFSAKSIYS
jgi:hypothetical protein